MTNIRSTKLLVENYKQKFLPYSTIIHLLHDINDESLTQKVKYLLLNELPQKQDYENDIDLWVDLESMGEIRIVIMTNIIKTIDNHLTNPHIFNVYQMDLTTQDNISIFKIIKLHSKKILIDFTQSNKERRFNENYISWFTDDQSLTFNFESEISSILYYAWKCAQLGAEEVGFNILETGYQKVSQKYLKSFYLVQLQFMRIATQHYFSAANEQRVIEPIFTDLLQSFYLTIAWGSVLSKQITKAEHYFKKANVTMETIPEDIDSLYRLNIFALSQYLNQKSHNAFTIENKIKEAINNSPSYRPQIKYINSINLARLYRSANDYYASKNHYEMAFLTTHGIKSDTDFIYYNVCYAMLEEKNNNHYEAFLYWLRAALHWEVMECKEALGWRAVRAITNYNFTPRSVLDINSVTDAFIHKLTQLGHTIDLNYNSQITTIFHFAQATSALNLNSAKYFGIPGLSLITINKSISLPQSTNLTDLTKLLSQILIKIFNFKYTKNMTVILDRTNGIEVPTDLHSIMSSCYLFHINKIIYNNKHYFIKKRFVSMIRKNCTIKLNPSLATSSINEEDNYVKHTRYIKKIPIKQHEKNILLRLKNCTMLPYSSINLKTNDILKLIEKKLIMIELSTKILI